MRTLTYGMRVTIRPFVGCESWERDEDCDHEECLASRDGDRCLGFSDMWRALDTKAMVTNVDPRWEVIEFEAVVWVSSSQDALPALDKLVADVSPGWSVDSMEVRWVQDTSNDQTLFEVI